VIQSEELTPAIGILGVRWPVIALALLVVAYLGLAVVYNVATPIFEAPDENWHYEYVRYLSEFRALPVQNSEATEGLGKAEAGQPPLYYAVASALTFWAPRGDVARIATYNPSGSVGDPRTAGNKNRFLHGPDQAFPWRGEVLTVHLVRFTTTLWGLATVLLTFLLGRDVFSSDALGLAAAAAVAFTPQFIFMSAAVSNDVPVAATSALLLWLAVRSARRGPTLGGSALVGLATGLVILTHPIAVGGIVLAVGAVALGGRRAGRQLRLVAGYALVALVGTLAVCGWWFARNVALYGKLTPVDTFLTRTSLFDQVPTLREALVDLVGLKMSYWALFGWFSILAPPAYYTFFDALMIAAVAGLVIALLVRVVRPGGQAGLDGWGLALVAFWGLTAFLALCVYRLIVLAFQGRLMFAGIAAYAVLLVFGWSSLAPRRFGKAIAGVLSLALLVPAARAPWTMLQPAYALPPVVEAASIAPAVHLQARFADEVALLGADVTPPLGTRLSPGDPVQVTLYWQGQRPMTRDYLVSVQLDDPAQNKLAAQDSMPGQGMLPTSAWEPGKVVVDRYQLRVGSDATGPRVARLSVILYLPGTFETLPVYDSSGVKLAGPLSVGTYVVRGPTDLARAAGGVPFAGQISLVDSTVDQKIARPGDDLTGRIVFGDLQPMARDYTVFVHLEGERGLVVGDDGQPAGGMFPTSFWQPGDLVRQSFRLRIPSSTVPGDYVVRAGWYDLATGRRLITPGGDAVDLGTVSIK
jgi:hypothetical protein